MNNREKVRDHYDRMNEAGRLAEGEGRFEYLRSLDIIGRFLPAAPGRVLDLGGADGRYAFRLAELGHRVTLVDLTPKHVSAARARNALAKHPLEAIEQGDACRLALPDNCFDLVLTMGPLYHLLERADRLQALGHVQRVLKPGGTVVATYISRFASLADGFRSDYLTDPVFRSILDGDLSDGRHLSDDDKYFTQAYFHHPDEIEPELAAVGFSDIRLFAVEGMFWTNPALASYLGTEERLDLLLDYARRTEADRSLMGASAHIMAVARR
jgi:SAM-dependent methyltransferase